MYVCDSLNQRSANDYEEDEGQEEEIGEKEGGLGWKIDHRLDRLGQDKMMVATVSSAF